MSIQDENKLSTIKNLKRNDTVMKQREKRLLTAPGKSMRSPVGTIKMFCLLSDTKRKHG